MQYVRKCVLVHDLTILHQLERMAILEFKTSYWLSASILWILALNSRGLVLVSNEYGLCKLEEIFNMMTMAQACSDSPDAEGT